MLNLLSPLLSGESGFSLASTLKLCEVFFFFDLVGVWFSGMALEALETFLNGELIGDRIILCSGEKCVSPLVPSKLTCMLADRLLGCFFLASFSFFLGTSFLLPPFSSSSSPTSSSSIILSPPTFLFGCLNGDLLDFFCFSFPALSTSDFFPIKPTPSMLLLSTEGPSNKSVWLWVWLGSKNPLLGILVMSETFSSGDPYTTFVFFRDPLIVVGSSI